MVWNVRGWRSKNAEMQKRCQGFDIGLFTELKNKRGEGLNLPGFESVVVNNFNQGLGGAGGVGIAIRKGYKWQEINLSHCHKDFDICGIKLFGELGKLNIICVYRRSGKRTRKGAWSDIFKHIDPNEGLLLAGDFNAHHAEWNCPRNDWEGEQLHEEMEMMDMFIINDDTLSRWGEVGFTNDNLRHVMKYKQEKEAGVRIMSLFDSFWSTIWIFIKRKRIELVEDLLTGILIERY